MLVRFCPFKRVETKMTVETFGLRILLIYIYIKGMIVFDGDVDKLLTESAAEMSGRDEQHFDFLSLDSHKGDGCFTLMEYQ